jgi:hypothetical protein
MVLVMAPLQLKNIVITVYKIIKSIVITLRAKILREQVILSNEYHRLVIYSIQMLSKIRK